MRNHLQFNPGKIALYNVDVIINLIILYQKVHGLNRTTGQRISCYL